MATEFDTDTALRDLGDGHFEGAVTDRWMIGGGPNGGYIASILLRGLMAVSPQPDPLSMTTHYVGRPEQGPCQVSIAVSHSTRSHAFMDAALVQHGTVRARSIAVFGRRRDDQPYDVDLKTPAVTPPGVGVPVREVPLSESMPLMSFIERFTYRAPNSADPFAGNGAHAVVGGWTRLNDRDLDTVAVPLFTDCWPPPIFMRRGPGLAPTIELTIHFRNNPEPGWVWCQFQSRVLAGGYVEEDGEIWSERGNVLAMSRQISRFTAAPAPPSASAS
ncbi:MAG: thioesterase family protein [Actinobacteria bacterium]|nr:thioesterase family protein [Actinomycetota bacterium]